ncbi:MAG: hypothetical protein PHH11_04710 [Methylomonas sp.]|nr:hypothetical protein [Methylomonas sp.]
MTSWKSYSCIRIALIALVFLLSACTTTPRQIVIRSDVDALASSDVQNKRRFVILPGNQELKEQDLQFIEFKTYVEKILTKRGFIKVDALQEGELAIFMSYGVGEPQTYQHTYEVPVWNDMGFYPYYRRYRYYPMMSTYYAQRIEPTVLYKRHLLLEAYDMTAYLQQKAPQQLWKISVQSQGASNDLRLAFPFMVTAMHPHIATNTGHMVTVDVIEHDPLLDELLPANRKPVSPVSLPDKK